MSRRCARSIAFALTALLWIAGCGPSDPVEHARALQQSGQHEEALELLSGLVEERPSDAELQYLYAVSLMATGKESLAKWPLLRAMESEEWLERSGLALAQTLMAQDRVDEALGFIERVLEAHPDNHEARILRATATMRSRRGDYEAALADAEKVLEADPDNLAALVPKTAALLGLERIEEAAAALEQLEGAYRDDTLGLHGSAPLCAAQATFLKEKGEQDRAEARFLACMEAFPDSGMMLAEVVKFYEETQRSERAEQVLREALASKPGDIALRSSLVDRLAAQGRQEEVERLIRAATEVEAPEAAASGWFTLGLYQLERNDTEASVDSFERAVALDVSRTPELVFAYADGLAIAGRYDEALRVADQLSVPAHRLLVKGRVELERDRPREALEHFTEANRLWPDNAVARYYTAVAAERLGQFRRAIEDYRYSMRVDSKITDAYLRLARLQFAAGHYDAALTSAGFQPGNRQSEREGRLLSLELLARLGRNEPRAIWKNSGASDGAAAAAIARGLGGRIGAGASVKFLSGLGLDLDDPEQAEALRELADGLVAESRADEALARVEAALKAAPEAPVFHALHGRVLMASGAEPARARQAFERALELDDEEPLALAGLAALTERAGDLEAALALYERAAASDGADRASARTAASLLDRLDRGQEAEARLRELLETHPYDAQAALALAELRLARGAEDPLTRDLARRAVGFGGGEPALALAERLGISSAAGGLDDDDAEGAQPAEGADSEGAQPAEGDGAS